MNLLPSSCRFRLFFGAILSFSVFTSVVKADVHLAFANSTYAGINGHADFNAFLNGTPLVLHVSLDAGSAPAAKFVEIKIENPWLPVGITEKPVFDQVISIDHLPFDHDLKIDLQGQLGGWQLTPLILDGDHHLISKGATIDLAVVKEIPATPDPKAGFFGFTDTVNPSRFESEFFHKALGVNFIRSSIMWNYLEPNNKKDVVKSVGDGAKRHLDDGFYVMIGCFFTPAWAEPPGNPFPNGFGPPANLNDFADYLKTAEGIISSRYGSGNFAWSLWNEPDQDFWHGTAQQFVDMMKVYHDTLKGLNPKYQLVGFDPTGLGFIKQVCDLGGIQYCDVFGIHTYMENSPEEAGLEAKIHNLRELRDKFGPGKAMWDTEYNFKGEGEAAGAEAGQAFQLVRGHAILIKEGITKFSWYGFNFDDGGLSSMRTPAIAAFSECSRMLDQTKFVKSLDITDALKGYTRCYLFQRDETVRAVVWRLGQPSLLHFATKAKCQAFDINGNSIPLAGADSSVQISHRPIYLTFPASELTEMSTALQAGRVDPVADEFKTNEAVRMELTPLMRKLTDRPELHFKVMLSAGLPEGGTLTLTKLPQGWTTDKTSAPVTGAGVSNGMFNIDDASFTLTAAPRNEYNNALFEDKNFPIEYRYTGKDGKTYDGGQILSWQACVYTATPPKIDGDISADWKDALPVQIGKSVYQRQQSWVMKGMPWAGPEDLSAVFYFMWDEKYFYIAAKVVDDKHVQKGGEAWREDSIQLGLGDDYRPLIYLQGDTPHFENLPASTKLAAKQVGNVTYYEMAIPLSDYSFVKPKAGNTIGINMVLNDEDDDGRGRHFLEYSEGISTNKDTSKYARWVFLK